MIVEGMVGVRLARELWACEPLAPPALGLNQKLFVLLLTEVIFLRLMAGELSLRTICSLISFVPLPVR